jgi:hypothetical protein
VLLEDLGAGEATVIFRDRRQDQSEAPSLEVRLEFLDRDQVARLIDVVLVGLGDDLNRI